MFIIISYDIVDDRRRTKVMKLLKGHGTRVQYSVFECHLSQEQLERLARELKGAINLNTDSVRCYLLDADAVARIRIVGIGRVSADSTHIIV